MNDDLATDHYLDDQHAILMRKGAQEAEIRDMEAAAEQRYRNGGKDLTPAAPTPAKQTLRPGVGGMRLPLAAMRMK